MQNYTTMISVDKLSERDSKNDIFNIQNEVVSVNDINKLAKALLENNMPICWIKGEISSLKQYSHVYFDLKDEKAKISCVVFANNLSLLECKLENGTKVEVKGRITLYAQNGSYQINIERMRKVGIGELWEAYNRLLQKLQQEGLFAKEHKKILPQFPKAIGVITSKEGAVIKDVITTLKRRINIIPIIIYHSLVQGQDAALQITKAIRNANVRKEVDVLIICRGGGSIEDLWCFNEEIVVREIYNSQIPIISAIGHETDTTLTDFVADIRAATPTAAAEIVVKSITDWNFIIDRNHYKMINKMHTLINNYKQGIDALERHIKLLSPINQIKQRSLEYMNLKHRLNAIMLKMLKQQENYYKILQLKLINAILSVIKYNNNFDTLEMRLYKSVVRIFEIKTQSLIKLSNSLTLLNPRNILQRGYAIVTKENGKVVSSKNVVELNENLKINFYDNTIDVIVNSINK